MWPTQCVSSPTGALRGAVAVNPKLMTCYKLSQETWSSAGSRHSSRPGKYTSQLKPRLLNSILIKSFHLLGSSLASSRPSSQCASLYCRSNNSSLSGELQFLRFQSKFIHWPDSILPELQLAMSHFAVFFPFKKFH